MTERIPVECSKCDTRPTLYATPYSDGTEFVVECECPINRSIRVDESVGDSALLEPMTGVWNIMDHGSDLEHPD